MEINTGEEGVKRQVRLSLSEKTSGIPSNTKIGFFPLQALLVTHSPLFHFDFDAQPEDSESADAVGKLSSFTGF